MKLAYKKVEVPMAVTANNPGTTAYEVMIGRWKLGLLLTWDDDTRVRFHGNDNNYDEIEVDFNSVEEFEDTLGHRVPPSGLDARPSESWMLARRQQNTPK